MTEVQFQDWQLRPELLRAIEDLGFERPTPIQTEAVPLILEGHDLIGQAQTGTGKTAAFGIPLLNKIKNNHTVEVLILTPTRELAIQVSEELSRLAKYIRVRILPVYGGQSIDRQIRVLRQKPSIVVGTPGRVLDHLSRGTLSLADISAFILDEADEMLDMGFIDDIEKILGYANEERQTLLFSATMPPPIRKLAQRYLKNPRRVAIQPQTVTVPLIEQAYYEVKERQKLDALCRILDVENPERGVIFCRTKRGVDELATSLQGRGYQAEGLHGDLSQRERDRVMQLFRSGQADLLVATDVAARGLDIAGVSHVINYDIPQDTDTYVHRIGRTGRAGQQGIAYTLITRRERQMLSTIERHIKLRIPRRALPTVDDLRERRLSQLRDNILTALHNNRGESYRSLASELIEEEDSVELLASAMAIIIEHEGRSWEYFESDPIDPFASNTSGHMVRLFINIGRRDGIGPGDIVGAIAGEAGIPGHLIGKIDIFDRFTFVEVPSEYEQVVLDAMRSNTIRGKEVSIQPARGGRSSYDGRDGGDRFSRRRH